MNEGSFGKERVRQAGGQRQRKSEVVSLTLEHIRSIIAFTTSRIL